MCGELRVRGKEASRMKRSYYIMGEIWSLFLVLVLLQCFGLTQAFKELIE